MSAGLLYSYNRRKEIFINNIAYIPENTYTLIQDCVVYYGVAMMILVNNGG